MPFFGNFAHTKSLMKCHKRGLYTYISLERSIKVTSNESHEGRRLAQLVHPLSRENQSAWMSCQNLRLFPLPAMLNPRRQILTARLHRCMPTDGRLFREKSWWKKCVYKISVDCLLHKSFIQIS